MIRVTIIRQGSDEGGEVKEFLSGQITIGRVERNDLVLVNNRVSSVHARVVQAEGGGVTLIDNNSTNGTFVNGALVRGPVAIEPDDSVEIGTFTLHFEHLEVEEGGDEGGEDMSEIAPAEFDEFSEEPGEFSEPDLLPELHEPQPEATPQEAFRPPSQLHRRPRPVEVPVEPSRPRTRTFADEPLPRAAPTPTPVPAPVLVPATGLAGAFARCAAAVAAEGETPSEARALVHARPAVDACCADLDPRQRRQWSEWIAREVAGVGALTDILADATVSEILIQGATLIELRRDGVRARHPTRFSCAQALELALQRMIGAAPSESQPVVDGVNQLPALGEVAVHAVGRPLVHGGPVVLLSRPQAGPRSLADLVTHGQLSAEAAGVLEDAAMRGANLLVCGPPGLDCSGWLAAVAAGVPEACRVVAVHRGMIARALVDSRDRGRRRPRPGRRPHQRAAPATRRAGRPRGRRRGGDPAVRGGAARRGLDDRQRRRGLARRRGRAAVGDGLARGRRRPRGDPRLRRGLLRLRARAARRRERARRRRHARRGQARARGRTRRPLQLRTVSALVRTLAMPAMHGEGDGCRGFVIASPRDTARW